MPEQFGTQFGEQQVGEHLTTNNNLWDRNAVVTNSTSPPVAQPPQNSVYRTGRSNIGNWTGLRMDEPAADCRIAVVSYNLLSPALSTPASHLYAQEDYLEPEYRFPKIREKLTDEVISKGAICCLQEVGLAWHGNLQVFFEYHDYSFITTNYGNAFNDYMGCAIAYPRAYYELKDCSVERLSEVYLDASKDEAVNNWNPIAEREVPPSVPPTPNAASVVEQHNTNKQEDSGTESTNKNSFTMNGGGDQLPPNVNKSDNINNATTTSSESSAPPQMNRRKHASFVDRLKNLGEAVKEVVFPSESSVEKIKEGEEESSTKGGAEDNNGAAPLETLPPEETGWEIAERRFNRVIMCKFQVRGTRNKFAVANYHNPCLFGTTEKVKALAIHTAWLLENFEVFATDPYTRMTLPRIICGDFNFSPTNSAIYSWVTSARDDLAKELGVNEGKPPKYEEWHPEFVPMDSAYSLHSVQNAGPLIEPECTCYASARNEEEENFCDTLDFIFLSKNHWDVTNLIKLPTAKEIKSGGVLPNAREPSDHLMIGCELDCRKFTFEYMHEQQHEPQEMGFDQRHGMQMQQMQRQQNNNWNTSNEEEDSDDDYNNPFKQREMVQPSEEEYQVGGGSAAPAGLAAMLAATNSQQLNKSPAIAPINNSRGGGGKQGGKPDPWDLSYEQRWALRSKGSGDAPYFSPLPAPPPKGSSNQGSTGSGSNDKSNNNSYMGYGMFSQNHSPTHYDHDNNLMSNNWDNNMVDQEGWDQNHGGNNWPQKGWQGAAANYGGHNNNGMSKSTNNNYNSSPAVFQNYNSQSSRGFAPGFFDNTNNSNFDTNNNIMSWGFGSPQVSAPQGHSSPPMGGNEMHSDPNVMGGRDTDGPSHGQTMSHLGEQNMMYNSPRMTAPIHEASSPHQQGHQFAPASRPSRNKDPEEVPEVQENDHDAPPAHEAILRSPKINQN